MSRLMGWILIGGWIGVAGAQMKQEPVACEERTEDTLAVLQTRLSEVAFDETPLDQALEWLAREVGADFVVHWPALEEYGIGRDFPVTLKIHNLRFSQALWMILGQAGGTDVRLAYRAEGKLVLVSSAADLERELVTKVYDVSDLLIRTRRFADCPQVDLTQSGQAGSTTVMRSSEGGGSDNESRAIESADQSASGLLVLIQQTIEPDSWQSVGGLGTIYPYGDCLVVRNTHRVHQALAGYGREEGGK